MEIFTASRSNIHTLKPGDPDFKLSNGLVISDRASIEITPSCPTSIAETIVKAYRAGWIVPVAHISDREKLFIGLTK
jgi:hypothetical protein